MKRTAFAALLFAVPFAAFGASTQRQAVMVMTRPAAAHVTIKSLAATFDPAAADERDLREFTAIHGFAANLTAEEITSLKASGEVISIEPDGERHAFFDTVTTGKQTIPYGLN